MSEVESGRRLKRRGQLPGWVFWVAAVVLFLAVMFTTAAVTFFQNIHQDIPDEPGQPPVPKAKPDERVNVLFLGIDECQEGGPARSDTIIVVSFDPETGSLTLLSIPRDSRVAIPGRGPDKMGHAHAHGGPRLVMQTVEELLDIPVHYYIRTDLEGFERIVDILGGVEIDVPIRMYYEDPYQDLVIDLMPGKQLLDGHKAMQFVRYRGYHDADFGRIRAQQAFISALVERMFKLQTVFKLPAIAGQLAKHVETNMTATEMLKFASWAVNVNADAMVMEMLAGEPAYIEEHGIQVSYVLLNQDEVRMISDRLFRGVEYEPPVRVEVYNGSGRSGLARWLADRLEGEGFQVVLVANADQMDYERTLVVGEKDDVVNRVIDHLLVMRIGAERGNDERDLPLSGADVRIVIGMDYPEQVE